MTEVLKTASSIRPAVTSLHLDSQPGLTSKQTAPLDDWRRNIGSFVLNFGALEYLVTVFLKDNLEPAEYARYMKRLFKDRVERIAKYINENDYSQVSAMEFPRQGLVLPRG